MLNNSITLKKKEGNLANAYENHLGLFLTILIGNQSLHHQEEPSTYSLNLREVQISTKSWFKIGLMSSEISSLCLFFPS